MKKLLILITLINTVSVVPLYNGILYTQKPGYPSMNISSVYLWSSEVVVKHDLGFILLNIFFLFSVLKLEKSKTLSFIGVLVFFSFLLLLFNFYCLVYYYGWGPLAFQII